MIPYNNCRQYNVMQLIAFDTFSFVNVGTHYMIKLQIKQWIEY